jgi:hypothetical protein
MLTGIADMIPTPGAQFTVGLAENMLGGTQPLEQTPVTQRNVVRGMTGGVERAAVVAALTPEKSQIEQKADTSEFLQQRLPDPGDYKKVMKEMHPDWTDGQILENWSKTYRQEADLASMTTPQSIEKNLVKHYGIPNGETRPVSFMTTSGKMVGTYETDIGHYMMLDSIKKLKNSSEYFYNIARDGGLVRIGDRLGGEKFMEFFTKPNTSQIGKLTEFAKDFFRREGTAYSKPIYIDITNPTGAATSEVANTFSEFIKILQSIK